MRLVDLMTEDVIFDIRPGWDEDWVIEESVKMIKEDCQPFLVSMWWQHVCKRI